MNETVTNELLLEHLKRLQSGQARLIEDVGDLKLRMTALEESNATMAHTQATMAQSIAGQSKRMDRMKIVWIASNGVWTWRIRPPARICHEQKRSAVRSFRYARQS